MQSSVLTQTWALSQILFQDEPDKRNSSKISNSIDHPQIQSKTNISNTAKFPPTKIENYGLKLSDNLPFWPKLVRLHTCQMPKLLQLQLLSTKKPEMIGYKPKLMNLWLNSKHLYGVSFQFNP